MATIRKEIELLTKSWNTTSSSYSPTAAFNGLSRFTKADWDPLTAVYFEVSFEFIGGGGGSEGYDIQLYDHTNSTVIKTISGSADGHQRRRSVDILGDMPASADYRLRWKIDDPIGGDSVSIHTAKLIIIQTGTLKKTCSYFVIGDIDATPSTSYVEVDVPKHHKQVTANYTFTVLYEFQATIVGTLGFPRRIAGYAELWDIDDSVQIRSVSTTSILPAMVIDNTGATPTTGNKLTTRIKTDAGGNATIYHAQFVIKQSSATNIIKTVSPHHVIHGGFSESDQAYDLGNRPWGSYDPAEYVGVTITANHECMLSNTNADQDGYVNVSNKNGGGAALANSEVTTTSITYDYEEAVGMSVPTADVDLFQDAYIDISGAVITASSRMNVFLTNILKEGRRRTNVS